MGGAIALEFALRYPARLAGLILVGTGAKLRVAPEILTGVLDDYAGTAELLAQWAHGERAIRTCCASTRGGCAKWIPGLSAMTSSPATSSTVALA